MTRLVLVPGLAGDETMWRAQLAGLRDRNPVVTDVHMHHGSIEAMAAALLAAYAGPLAVCGASMGGMIAMEAARQAPGRIVGLAILGTTARPESREMRTLREAACELFAQGRVAEVIEPNVALAFHPDQARDAELTRAYVDFVLRAGADQLIRQNRAVMARPDARPHLPTLRCATLVMCGDGDQLVTAENSREIAALVPGARFIELARCGHMLTMEKPEEVNAALRGWLESIDGPRG